MGWLSVLRGWARWYLHWWPMIPSILGIRALGAVAILGIRLLWDFLCFWGIWVCCCCFWLLAVDCCCLTYRWGLRFRVGVGRGRKISRLSTCCRSSKCRWIRVSSKGRKILLGIWIIRWHSLVKVLIIIRCIRVGRIDNIGHLLIRDSPRVRFLVLRIGNRNRQ